MSDSPSSSSRSAVVTAAANCASVLCAAGASLAGLDLRYAALGDDVTFSRFVRS